MISAGIDSGSQNTKAVLVKDGVFVSAVNLPTEFDIEEAAGEAYKKLLIMTKLNQEDVDVIAATGAGREGVSFADIRINEVISAAKGAFALKPDCRTIIEMGADSSRVVSLNEDGSVKTYEANDKCASGSGIFIETIARILGMTTEELGICSLSYTAELPMNAQCVVFVESEVISLIHQNESKENIARAVLSGIAGRVCSPAKRMETAGGVVFIGGPSLNKGLAKCIEKELKQNVFVPENPEYVSAFGAALYAASKYVAGMER